MRILLAGDVVGRAGREAVLHHLPKLREEFRPDFVLVNGDNAAAGFGITPKLCEEFFAAGVDVITGGDHIWDQQEIVPYISSEKRLLRPLNLPKSVPGTGMGIFEAKGGKKVLVVHVLGQVFIRDNPDCPFAAAQAALSQYRMGNSVQAILVDCHAEATSEKNAMGMLLDGQVSAVFGTHTHVPTADARILPKGTAYHTDLGMCGDYNSVIGFSPEGPLASFLSKMRRVRMQPSLGEGTFAGLFVETDDATGLAREVRPVIRGGALDQDARRQ